MTGFRQLGYNATMEDVITERRNDVAVVDYLMTNKSQGRNRTGLRALPTSETQLITGDLKGDFVDDFVNEFRYQISENNGTLQWVRWTIETSFTNP